MASAWWNRLAATFAPRSCSRPRHVRIARRRAAQIVAVYWRQAVGIAATTEPTDTTSFASAKSDGLNVEADGSRAAGHNLRNVVMLYAEEVEDGELVPIRQTVWTWAKDEQWD